MLFWLQDVKYRNLKQMDISWAEFKSLWQDIGKVEWAMSFQDAGSVQ